MRRIQVLLVDDEPEHLELAQRFLSRLGDNYETHTASSVDDAINMINSISIHVLVCDGNILGRSGEEVLSYTSLRSPDTYKIMCSGSEDCERIAKKHEALWISKDPLNNTYHKLVDAVRDASIRKGSLEEELAAA